MKERIIGLFKSIVMRLQLILSPIMLWVIKAVSLINAITSIGVIAFLVYALGFPVSFDNAISVPLFSTFNITFLICSLILVKLFLISLSVAFFFIFNTSFLILSGKYILNEGQEIQDTH